MEESMFKKSSDKRAIQQASIQAANGLDEKVRKERYNISLYPTSQKKLADKAAELNISVSSLIEIWIAEKCE